MKKITSLVLVLVVGLSTAALAQKDHPSYLHALADLRDARWMLNHRPGNWVVTEDEKAAVKKIDEAIAEIKRAAIDDHKDINDHVKADEINEHRGRITKAFEYLERARNDVNKDEDNDFAKGLKKRALVHINEAIRLTEKAKAATK